MNMMKNTAFHIPKEDVEKLRDNRINVSCLCRQIIDKYLNGEIVLEYELFKYHDLQYCQCRVDEDKLKLAREKSDNVSKLVRFGIKLYLSGRFEYKHEW